MDVIQQVNQTNEEIIRLGYSASREELETRPEYKALSAYNKDLAMAFLNPRVANYETEYLKVKIKLLIVDVHDWTNKDIDEGNVEDTIGSFAEELKRYASTFTLEELRLCFRNGVLMKYGDYFGLNVATYWIWIGRMQTDEDRNIVRRMVEKREKKDEKPALTDEQKEQIIIDAIVRDFNIYCKEGAKTIYHFSTVHYDYLKRLGIIDINEERQARIREIARVKIRERAIENKGTKTVQQALSELDSNILIAECKRRALEEYFIGWKELGEDLAQLIADTKAKPKDEEATQ